MYFRDRFFTIQVDGKYVQMQASVKVSAADQASSSGLRSMCQAQFSLDFKAESLKALNYIGILGNILRERERQRES